MKFFGVVGCVIVIQIYEFYKEFYSCRIYVNVWIFLISQEILHREKLRLKLREGLEKLIKSYEIVLSGEMRYITSDELSVRFWC